MKTKKLSALLLPIALCLSLVVPQQQAQANEIDTVSEIQQAIDTASSKGGGIVNLPAKTINVDKMIVLKSNVHLKGSGVGKTKLVLTNPGLQKMLTSDRTTKSELSGITFDARKDLRKDKVNSGNYHTMDFAYATNFRIHSIEVINSVDAAIALWYADHGVIENSTLKNGGSNAILGMQKTHHIDILNNTIDKTDHQNGIFFMFQGESTNDINIIGNKVTNVADYAIEVGHTTHGKNDAPHRNIIVKDNVIENAYCTGIGLRTVSDAVVEGNTIRGYAEAKGYGCNAIFVEGRASQQKNVDVKNNTIIQTEKNVKKTDSDATPYQQAMYITGMRDMDITGNTITVENPNNTKNKNWSDGIKVIASWGAEGFTTGRREFQDIRVNNNTITNVEVNGITFESAGSTGNTANNNTISKFGGKGIHADKNVVVEQVGNKIGGEVVPPVVPPTEPEVPVVPPVTPTEPVTPEPPVVTPEVPTIPEVPVTPVDPENIWSNPITIEPLGAGYPKAQRLQIKPAKYVISFEAKSTSGSSTLNLYFDKRDSLNQHLILGTVYKSYKFEFETKVEQEIFFLAMNNAKDISVKNIKLVKASEPKPDPDAEREKTFLTKVSSLISKVKELFSKDNSQAESLIDEFIKIVDEKLKK